MPAERKLSRAGLEALLAAPNTTEDVVREYFVDDEDREDPFTVSLKSAPGVTVEDPLEEFGLVLDLVNAWVRSRRKKRYDKMIEEHPDRPRLVAEGDSWFQHPLVKETIDHLVDLYGYPIRSLDAAGDTLEQIVAQDEYVDTLKQEKAKALLLSGGGNDLMGDRFGNWLNAYTPGCPGVNPDRFIDHGALDPEMNELSALYEKILVNMAASGLGVPVFVHTYDYVVPRGTGKWLGRPMIAKGIADPRDHAAIIKLLIDKFTAMLEVLAAKHSNVRLVDNRSSVPPLGWYDEIHPSDAGFVPVAMGFRGALADYGIV